MIKKNKKKTKTNINQKITKMLPEKIKKNVDDCEKNAIRYEQMAKILREYANLQTQLNVTGAMIINREDKQSRLKELADKFNDLSLSNLFMKEL